ncbi:MAG: type II toxin-antitoxin system TacA family antitoxin [Thiotrichales bacterium]
MATETQKDKTLKFRMDEMTLDLLDRARGYVDMNKSSFIRWSIKETAESVIAEHDKTRFSHNDWLVFFDRVNQPTEPTERMKRAQEKYKQIIG